MGILKNFVEDLKREHKISTLPMEEVWKIHEEARLKRCKNIDYDKNQKIMDRCDREYEIRYRKEHKNDKPKDIADRWTDANRWDKD